MQEIDNNMWSIEITRHVSLYVHMKYIKICIKYIKLYQIKLCLNV